MNMNAGLAVVVGSLLYVLHGSVQTIDEYATRLKSWGYNYSSDHANLLKGDLSVRSYIGTKSGSGKGPINGMMLFKSFPIPASLNDKTVTKWLLLNDPSGLAKYRIQIDETISIQAQVPADSASMLPPTRDQLDEVWKRLSNLQNWLGSWPASGTQIKVEDRIVRSLDHYDVGWLIGHWKWQPHGGSGGSTAVWIVPAVIDGTYVVISGPMNREESETNSAIYIRARVELPKGANPQDFTSQLSKSEHWAEFNVSPVNNSVYAESRIVLSKGLAVAKVKTLIADFAQGLSRLQRKFER